MNAVIYARYSSHSQTEQSIEGHKKTARIADCSERWRSPSKSLGLYCLYHDTRFLSTVSIVSTVSTE